MTHLKVIDDTANMSKEWTNITTIEPRLSISFFSTNPTQIIITNNHGKHNGMIMVTMRFNEGRKTTLNMKECITMNASDETKVTNSFITHTANQMLVIGFSVEKEKGVGMVVDRDER